MKNNKIIFSVNLNKFSYLIFITENPDHEIPYGPEIKLSLLNLLIIFKFYDKIFINNKLTPKIFFYFTQNFIFF